MSAAELQDRRENTHEARIEKYLLQPGASITQLEALRLFGCMRLAAAIHRLRKKHDQIDTETVHENGSSFARYRIVKAGKQTALDLPSLPGAVSAESRGRA